jgi:hypothetical protein
MADKKAKKEAVFDPKANHAKFLAHLNDVGLAYEEVKSVHIHKSALTAIVNEKEMDEKKEKKEKKEKVLDGKDTLPTDKKLKEP